MQQPPLAVARLISHLFLGLPDDGAAELAAWLSTAPRYREFVERHRDKIRKKLRGAVDADARRDVRAELRVARLLLGDRWIELGYEAYGSGRRGPDFTVTYRGERSLNLEVTRVRGTPDAGSIGRLVLAKLHQLPPSRANALIVASEAPAEPDAVEAAIRELRRRADRKDERFFETRGFDGSRDFYDRFLRLAVVLVWGGVDGDAYPTAAWVNASARIAAPKRTLRACIRSLDGASSAER